MIKTQSQNDTDIIIVTGLRIRVGQKLTITNQTISYIAFCIQKSTVGGAPAATGDVTFTIRKVSTDALIASKVWGDVSALQTSATWESVQLDIPVLVNEAVRLSVEFSGGTYTSGAYYSGIILRYQSTDVIAAEQLTYYPSSSWTDSTGDAAYYYTYTSTSNTVIAASSSQRMIRASDPTTWASARNGGNAAVIDPLVTHKQDVASWRPIVDTTYTIDRCFMDFDLSEIAPGTNITQARLCLYVTAKAGTSTNSIYLTKGYQDIPIVAANFDTSGYTQRDDVTSCGNTLQSAITLNQWNYIDLNAAGFTLVEAALGGTLKICLRYSFDLENVEPSNIGTQNIVWYDYQQPGFEPYLEIQAYDFLAVSTQAVTDISGQIATGNGRIDQFGSDGSVTQYGHCWSNTANPTTADTKTTLGAKTTLGSFTSDLTSLTPGATYHVRAYATDSVDTYYGVDVSFIAGQEVVSGTPIAGNIAVVQTRLHYIGDNGVEYYIQGSSVN